MDTESLRAQVTVTENQSQRRGLRYTFLNLQPIVSKWMKVPSYNAFRYGMISIYVGTLLMVIGYHNPYMAFSRTIGFAMVAFGFLMVFTAFIKSCKNITNGNRNNNDSVAEIDTVSHRIDSADSKRGLPTYDMAVSSELPTYEQALNQQQKYGYQNTALALPVPETPPPDWSPMHQANLTHVPPTPELQTRITIHQETNDTNSNTIAHPPAIYQIFGRTLSPNRVQPYENEGPSRQNSLISQPQSEPLPENSLPSATDRRRSLINDLRPRTSTTTILRSYSSSSFESPDEDEDQDSDWDESESIATDKSNKENIVM